MQMRLLQLAILATILTIAALPIVARRGGAPQMSAQASGKNSPEQLPFTDARNMTLMIFFADPPPRQDMLPVAHPNASGSGVWLGQAGYVATCQHVVADWRGPFKIGFARNSYLAEGGLTIAIGASINVWDADLVASDSDSDVAILKAHVTPRGAAPAPLVTGGPSPGEHVISPEIRITPKGAPLRTDFPTAGEALLLAGYPISQRTLILQVGPATGVNFPEGSTNYVASGLRIFLSLVSNPGNSGGPVIDVRGRVVGLLEGNLTSPIRDEHGRQLYSPTVQYDDHGNPARDASGQFIYNITPLRQNSGISIAIPALSIAQLAKKNNIDLD